MSWRRTLAPAIAVALALPFAAAHGEAYDPLVLEKHGFLGAAGDIIDAPPAAAALPFPAITPAGPGEPLRFAFTAPVRFAPAGGFVVDLTLRAEQPVLTGDGVEVAIEPGAQPARAALPPAMAPGETASVSITVQGAASYAKGDRVEVLVRPLAPVLAEGALVLLVGEGASTLAMHSMRVPSIADLELQDADLQQFLIGVESFAPPAGAVVNVFSVGHAGIRAVSAPGASANGTYVVLLGEEESADAAAHAQLERQARIDAAHTITVGDLPVRVHPGVGVVVPVGAQAVGLKCIASCPPGGWIFSLRGADGSVPATPTEKQSSLIPPPRDTRGIPVSEDEGPDEDKGVPMAAPLAALMVVAAAASLRRRR